MQSNSQIKRVFNQIARPLLAAGIMAVIIGCSAFEPEYGECPPIFAAKGAEESYLVGSKLGQIIKIGSTEFLGSVLRAMVIPMPGSISTY